MKSLNLRRMKLHAVRMARGILPEQVRELFKFNRKWFLAIFLALGYYGVLMLVVHNRASPTATDAGGGVRDLQDDWLESGSDPWDEKDKSFVGQFQSVLDKDIVGRVHKMAKGHSSGETSGGKSKHSRKSSNSKGSSTEERDNEEEEEEEEEEENEENERDEEEEEDEESGRERRKHSDEDEEDNDEDDDDDSEKKGKKMDRGYSVHESPWLYREPERTPIIQKGTKYVATYGTDELVQGAFSGRDRFGGCRYNKCSIIQDKSRADAVIFNGYVLDHFPIKAFWKRPPQQRWIFKTVDPVISDFGLNNDTLRSLFNWTSTYKIDSDIPSYLGLLTRKIDYAPKDYKKIYRKKTKMAAWFVSHCNTWSRREEYAERMASVARVDIFGRCGPFECGQNHGRMKYDIPECFPILSDTYKFYLSFENSFCHDYVTEKFFKVYLDVNVIPVVRGAVDYNNAFPKGTFINADDFESPEALMRFLVKLGNDEEAYTKMLAEKDKWSWTPVPESSFFCKLCRKLHTDSSVGHYQDVARAIQTDEEECWPPQDLGTKYRNYDMDMIREDPHKSKAKPE